MRESSSTDTLPCTVPGPCNDANMTDSSMKLIAGRCVMLNTYFCYLSESVFRLVANEIQTI